jgi:hypothetical protein
VGVGSNEINRQEALIDQFVATFNKLDEMTAFDHDDIALPLATGDIDEYGWMTWAPKKMSTDPALLQAIYTELPADFPPLFERLVLSYRWAEIDLQVFRLLPNPIGPDLHGLLNQITRDKAIWQCLAKSGYLQFGKGTDMDYDPVCFDIRSRTKNGDYRVVKIDHEEILCNDRLKVVGEVAPDFEELMIRTIDRAAKL